MHGYPEYNENGQCLLQLCCSNELCIMNTFFHHRDVHKNTWHTPSMVQKSLMDFCIVLSDGSVGCSSETKGRIVNGSTNLKTLDKQKIA